MLIVPLMLSVAAQAQDVPTLDMRGTCSGPLEAEITGLPGGSFIVVLGDSEGSTAVPFGGCAGTLLGVESSGPLQRFGPLVDDDGDGVLSFTPDVRGVCGRFVQVLETTECQVSEVDVLTESEPLLGVDGTCPGPMAFTVRDVPAGTRVGLLAGVEGSDEFLGEVCTGTPTELESPELLGVGVDADADGVVRIDVDVPADDCGQRVQAVSATCRTAASVPMDCISGSWCPLDEPSCTISGVAELGECQVDVGDRDFVLTRDADLQGTPHLRARSMDLQRGSRIEAQDVALVAEEGLSSATSFYVNYYERKVISMTAGTIDMSASDEPLDDTWSLVLVADGDVSFAEEYRFLTTGPEKLQVTAGGDVSWLKLNGGWANWRYWYDVDPVSITAAGSCVFEDDFKTGGRELVVECGDVVFTGRPATNGYEPFPAVDQDTVGPVTVRSARDVVFRDGVGLTGWYTDSGDLTVEAAGRVTVEGVVDAGDFFGDGEIVLQACEIDVPGEIIAAATSPFYGGGSVTLHVGESLTVSGVVEASEFIEIPYRPPVLTLDGVLSPAPLYGSADPVACD